MGDVEITDTRRIEYPNGWGKGRRRAARECGTHDCRASKKKERTTITTPARTDAAAERDPRSIATTAIGIDIGPP
jgi:hypothetical protein